MDIFPAHMAPIHYLNVLEVPLASVRAYRKRKCTLPLRSNDSNHSEFLPRHSRHRTVSLGCVVANWLHAILATVRPKTFYDARAHTWSSSVYVCVNQNNWFECGHTLATTILIFACPRWPPAFRMSSKPTPSLKRGHLCMCPFVFSCMLDGVRSWKHRCSPLQY